MQRGSPERRLWRWYRSLYPLTQIVLGGLALLVAFLACSLCVGVAPAVVQGVKAGFQRVAPGAIPTPITNHGPQMGAPLQSFANAYGEPEKDANGGDLFMRDGVQITVSVNSAQSVTRIAVVGPSSWGPGATQAYCEQFLPDGAQEYSSVPDQYIDYHSSMGDIVLQLQVTNCVLFIAPS